MSVSASARHAMPLAKKKRTGVFIKVGVAAGAATALLAGGAGTFAAWNDSSSISGGTVSTGQLQFDHSVMDTQTPTWFDETPIFNGTTTAPADTAIPAISGFKAVQGDVVRLKENITILATGTHLQGTVSVGTRSTTGSTVTPANWTVSAPTYDLSSTGGQVTNSGGVLTVNGTASTTSFTIPVTIDITFNSTTGDSPESGTADQNAAETLGLATLTLTQKIGRAHV